MIMLLPLVMAGLVPAIPIHETPRMRQFYVYILPQSNPSWRDLCDDISVDP
jgi:hypothetical protein